MLDLEQAIGATPDGGTFLIPPSDDGKPWANVYLRSIVKKPLGIIVAPQVVGSPACAVEGFVLQGSEGITFMGGLELLVDAAQKKAFSVQTGDRIHLQNLKIHGAGVLDGSGVSFAHATNSSIKASELHDMNGGISLSFSDSIVVDGNNIHDIGSDGIQSNGTNNVAITNNRLTRFFPAPGDHSDAIQFLTANQTAPTVNVTVAGNVFDRGVGVPTPNALTPGTQGVFMGDETGLGYKNVTIRDNAMGGVIYHGIALGLCDGAQISGNLVFSYTDTLNIDYSNDGQLINIVSWITADARCTNTSVSDNEATSFNQQTPSTVTWSGSQQISPVAPADAPAFISAWLASKQAPTPSPPPAPAPPPPATDPRDAQIAALTAKEAALLTAMGDIRRLSDAGRRARLKNGYFDQITAEAKAAIAAATA